MPTDTDTRQRPLRARLADLGRELRSREHGYIMVLAVLVGLLGGLGNLAFQFLIDVFRSLAWGGAESFVQRFTEAPLAFKLLVPVAGAFLGGLIIHFVAPEAKGHGVPEVMKAVALKGGVIPKRTAVGKTVASALCLASGGSVGREGPIVQIGSALGSAIGQMLKLNTARMRALVACGATAGIAATFNAPIAGAFFSAEVILGDFGAALFAPLVASAVTATLVSHIAAGADPAFLVPAGLTLVDGRELLLYALLGLAASLVAVAFMKVLHWAEDLFDRLPLWGPLRITLGGLGIGLVGLLAPHTLGNGYEGIAMAMDGELLLGGMALLLVLKILATSLTLGSGNSGGIFAPSLFMGVMFGGVCGHFFHAWFPGWTGEPGAYALVGMGAVVAAAIHAPITVIIMIFEMTRDYALILPLMIAVVMATLMSQKLQRHSIYTFKLARRGIDLLRGRDQNVLRRLKVEDIMRPHFDSVAASAPLASVLGRLAETDHAEILALDDAGRLAGIITLDEVKRALPQIDLLGRLLVAQDIMHEDPPTLAPGDDLDFAMQQFGRRGVTEIPVVDPADPGRPVGTLSRNDVIRAYNRAVVEEDLAPSLGSRFETALVRRTTETLGGYVLLQTEVPREMRGRTLGELDFRRAYSSQVVLICRGGDGDEERFSLPDRSTRLEDGDRLLVFGRREDVARIRNL